jgi:phenylacetate-CoA ligase
MREEMDDPVSWYVRDECRWPEPVATLAPRAPVFILRRAGSNELVAASAEEASALRTLQLLGGRPTTLAGLARLCHQRFRSELLDVPRMREVVGRLERFGFVERERADTATLRRTFQDAVGQWSREAQRQKLRRLVERLRSEIPFYRETLRTVDVERFNDISELPLLSKDQLRAHLPDLVAESDLRAGRPRWWSTSGTTGERLQIPQEDGYFARCRLLVGFGPPLPLGCSDSCAFLTTPVCSGTECHAEMDLPLEKRMFREGVFYLNSGMNPSCFPDEKLAAMVDELRSERVEYLQADAAYLVALARFVRSRRIRLGFRCIWLSYEVSSRIHLREIEEAFESPMLDLYGGTECGHLAVSCERGNLHAPPQHAILEILDRDLQRAEPGQVGRVVVTTLNQEFVPLLRYTTNDLARQVESCDCSLGSTAIGPIEGRTSELIADTRGAPITPRMVDDVVSNVATGIGWYSLVQIAPTAYRLLVVPVDGYDDTRGASVASALAERLGSDADVSVQPTRELRPSPSGKYRLCYREAIE